MFLDIQWLLQALNVFFEPSKRVFWGFLLSAVALIFLQWLLQGKKLRWRRIQKTFFSLRYWFNRSSVVDWMLMVANGILRVLVLVPLLGSHMVGAMWVGRWFQFNLGSAPDIQLPWLVIAALYTTVFFVVEDLSRFLLHRSMHKVPMLWRIHRVHHSARSLTPLTLFRVHPVEMTLYYLRGFIVFSTVSGFFIYWAGSQLSGLHILGVDALGFLFNVFGANLRHSHVWLGFGALERCFISPAQHQLHHSREAEHRDINFGSCLSWWDALAGSRVFSGRRRKLVFGLSEASKNL